VRAACAVVEGDHLAGVLQPERRERQGSATLVDRARRCAPLASPYGFENTNIRWLRKFHGRSGVAYCLDVSLTAAGSYQPGIFLSEGMMGIPWEGALMTGRGLGQDSAPNSPGGYAKTLRLVTLLHETAHYVQDLTLGTCIQHDRYSDVAGVHTLMAARLLAAQRGRVGCPLAASHGLEGDAAEHLAEARHAHGRAWALVDEGADVHRFIDGLRSPQLHDGLSGRMLIEGLTAVRVAALLAGRCRDEDDGRYLKAALRLVPMRPEDLPPLYREALELFTAVLPLRADPAEAVGDDAWPTGYFSSDRGYRETAFSFLADVALHVPPAEVSAHRIEAGVNTAWDFSPPHRFVFGLVHLLRTGGLPDATDPDGFYRRLFDELADALGWPTLEQTDGAWLELVGLLKAQRRSASDGYRARLLWSRHKRPALTSAADPFMTLFDQAVPVLHLTPTGLKLLRGVGGSGHTVVVPFELPGMDAMRFAAGRFAPWEDAPPQLTSAEAIEHQERMLPSFLQEVVFRALFRALYRAILSEPVYRCPFAERGCAAARPQCAALHRLDDAPEDGCALRVYLDHQGLDPAALRWRPE
jgi:hypothetical protein